MKKTIITISIIALSLAGLFYILNKNKAKNEAQTAIVAQKNEGVAVRVSNASYRDLSLKYVANGVFAPRQEVFISTEVPGKVIRVLVQEGASVKAGQTLAIIKGEQQNVAVANAQAVYNNAQQELKRFENAYSSGGVTQQQLDQVRLQLENAKNNLRSAQLNAGDVNVKASFSGVVNKRMVEPGAFVNPGQQLFEIVNIHTLKLKINVDEKTVGQIKLGQQVLVESPALPNQQWEGVVSFIAPKADASLNFPVELEIKNNGSNALKAGMYGNAIFGENQNINALVVPREAFVGNISSNKVFVAENGKAKLKEVTSGRNFGDYIEILSGIQEGEAVITSGQINLFNETPILVIQ